MLIGQILARSARKYGPRQAIIGEGRTLSYAELDAQADRFANALIAHGVAPGERVGILLRNVPEYPVAYFGIARAGAVSVHLPTRFSKGELGYVLNKIPLAALVMDSGLPQHIEWAAGFLPAERVIHAGGESGAAARRFARGFAPGFAGMIAAASAASPALSIDDAGPAAILFTSGTTGDPKGAIQPHHGRFLSARAALEDFGIAATDVLAVASPLYHAAGLCAWYQTCVLAGAAAVLLPAWEPGEFMDACAAHAITGAFAVPTQLAMLLRHPGFDRARLETLRLVVYGGAPADPALIAELEHALPRVRFVQNYGQTETGPLFSQVPEDRRANPAAIGRPNKLLEVEVFSGQGQAAAVGEVGEIATRGLHVTPGYYDDAAATGEFFKAGDAWGWTGDLAVRDAAGYLTLVGRTRDTIISGAVNIYPSELERVAAAHPDIADCAVFGVKDDVWGELPVIAVVGRPGAALCEADVLALFESGEIARFRRPRAVFLVESLPYTPAGKLLRGELKKRFPSVPAV